jgi:hypothetical protein
MADEKGEECERNVYESAPIRVLGIAGFSAARVYTGGLPRAFCWQTHTASNLRRPIELSVSWRTNN